MSMLLSKMQATAQGEWKSKNKYAINLWAILPLYLSTSSSCNKVLHGIPLSLHTQMSSPSSPHKKPSYSTVFSGGAMPCPTAADGT